VPSGGIKGIYTKWWPAVPNWHPIRHKYLAVWAIKQLFEPYFIAELRFSLFT